MYRVGPGLNCEKLHRCDTLAIHIGKKKVALADAKLELDTIIRAPPRYNWIFKLFCFGLSSGAIAPLFFNGGWVEAVMSFVMGVVVGSLCWGNYLLYLTKFQHLSDGSSLGEC